MNVSMSSSIAKLGMYHPNRDHRELISLIYRIANPKAELYKVIKERVESLHLRLGINGELSGYSPIELSIYDGTDKVCTMNVSIYVMAIPDSMQALKEKHLQMVDERQRTYIYSRDSELYYYIYNVKVFSDDADRIWSVFDINGMGIMPSYKVRYTELLDLIDPVDSNTKFRATLSLNRGAGPFHTVTIKYNSYPDQKEYIEDKNTHTWNEVPTSYCGLRATIRVFDPFATGLGVRDALIAEEDAERIANQYHRLVEFYKNTSLQQ